MTVETDFLYKVFQLSFPVWSDPIGANIQGQRVKQGSSRGQTGGKRVVNSPRSHLTPSRMRQEARKSFAGVLGHLAKMLLEAARRRYEEFWSIFDNLR